MSFELFSSYFVHKHTDKRRLSHEITFFLFAEGFSTTQAQPKHCRERARTSSAFTYDLVCIAVERDCACALLNNRRWRASQGKRTLKPFDKR